MHNIHNTIDNKGYQLLFASLLIYVCLMLFIVDFEYALNYTNLVAYDLVRELKMPRELVPYSGDNDECVKSLQQEWEILDDSIFIRKQNIHYFRDMRYLNLFVLLYDSETYNRAQRVKKELTFFLNGTQLTVIDYRDYFEYLKTYHLYQLRINFTLQESASFSTILIEVRRFASSRAFLEAKVKTFAAAKKKFAVVCTGCLDYGPDSTQLRWWLEVNARIGYDKIVICNNSIHHSNDRLLLASSLVELKQFKCMPYFLNRDTWTFVRAFSNRFLVPLWKHKVLLLDILKLIAWNECFDENVDQFEYVTVIDADETILPKKKKVSENSDNRACTGSDIKSYLQKGLNTTGTSLYFEQCHHLPQSSVAAVMKQFDRLSTTTFPFLIKATDKEAGLTFTFEIKDEREFNYARNLNALYEREIRPYMASLNQTNAFTRPFLLYGFVTGSSFGKSILSTARTHQVETHFPMRQQFVSVPYGLGCKSHFRDELEIRQWWLDKEAISVRRLVFDSNYFDCFMKPIIEHNQK